MIKSMSSTFLPIVESRAAQPQRKIPIGWTVIGAAVISFAIWYEVIVVGYRFIERLISSGLL